MFSVIVGVFFPLPADTPYTSWCWWNGVDDGVSEGPRFILGRTTARVLFDSLDRKNKKYDYFPPSGFFQGLAASAQSLSPADVGKVSSKLNTAWLPQPEPEGEHDWINTLQLHEVTAVWITGWRVFFSTEAHTGRSVCAVGIFPIKL